MWNDEDNNPYGAFDQHEAHLSDSLHSAALSARELPHHAQGCQAAVIDATV